MSTASASNQHPRCTICLEPVIVGSPDRGSAILKCAHQFHLVCIGADFNFRKRMQCPNCRREEEGDWRFAAGGFSQQRNDQQVIEILTAALFASESPDMVDSFDRDEDVPEISRRNVPSPFGPGTSTDGPHQQMSASIAIRHSPRSRESVRPIRQQHPHPGTLYPFGQRHPYNPARQNNINQAVRAGARPRSSGGGGKTARASSSRHPQVAGFQDYPNMVLSDDEED